MDFQGKFYSIKEITQETIINIDNCEVFRKIHNREKEKRFHMNGDILLNKECRERSWGTRKHFLK